MVTPQQFAPTSMFVRRGSPQCNLDRCRQGRDPCPDPEMCQSCGPEPATRPADWADTYQLSSPAELHDTGFGPLTEFGDAPESEWRTWTSLLALLTLWFLTLWGLYLALEYAWVHWR